MSKPVKLWKVLNRPHGRACPTPQIRSYVLDKSLIKDLRTGMETNDTKSFLDGDIDSFIHAQLLNRQRIRDYPTMDKIQENK